MHCSLLCRSLIVTFVAPHTHVAVPHTCLAPTRLLPQAEGNQPYQQSLLINLIAIIYILFIVLVVAITCLLHECVNAIDFMLSCVLFIENAHLAELAVVDVTDQSKL